ncbi:MAG: hypothetical protein HONBIEJF_00426 [Fimbriimonadaceae bacterium]|nr:hypothetical protein [Fimbriimonadaceae bacterium]
MIVDLSLILFVGVLCEFADFFVSTQDWADNQEHTLSRADTIGVLREALERIGLAEKREGYSATYRAHAFRRALFEDMEYPDLQQTYVSGYRRESPLNIFVDALGIPALVMVLSVLSYVGAKSLRFSIDMSKTLAESAKALAEARKAASDVKVNDGLVALQPGNLELQELQIQSAKLDVEIKKRELAKAEEGAEGSVEEKQTQSDWIAMEAEFLDRAREAAAVLHGLTDEILAPVVEASDYLDFTVIRIKVKIHRLDS